MQSFLHFGNIFGLHITEGRKQKVHNVGDATLDGVSGVIPKFLKVCVIDGIDNLFHKRLLNIEGFPIEGNGIHMVGSEADGFMLGSASRDL